MPASVAAWHRFVLCARAHGMPGLSDPRIDASGKAVFPGGLDVPPETRGACGTLIDRLVPSAPAAAPSPARRTALLGFARCMRDHGIPDWPDPNPLGEFPIDQRIRDGGKRLVGSAARACARLNPDPGGGIDATQAP